MHNFIRELSKLTEVDATVFALYYPHNQHEYYFYGAKVYSFGFKYGINRFDKLSIWKKCSHKFYMEQELKKFDIIHSFWSGESGYLASKLSKKYGIPHITTVCGGETASIPEIKYGSRLKFWQRRFVNRTFRQASVINALSNYAADQINEAYKNKYTGKIEILPFGLDEKLFCPLENNSPSKRLVNIANAVPVKAHDDLFRAFKLVLEKFPDLKLECFGRDDNNLLASLAANYGIEKSVVLNGYTGYEKLPLILNDSLIYVLSSLHEAENMSLVEAAFCGVPVVSTRVGSAAELTDYKVTPGNYRELAEKIIFVLDNYESERKKSLAKIQELHKKFSLGNSVTRFGELYRSLIRLGR
jgi:glycosyltransferase involved in cell wall biosynthesis